MLVSEDLCDELEAINSIYGDGTIVLKKDGVDARGAHGAVTAFLAIPDIASDDTDGATGHRVTVRLQFPAGYPFCPGPPLVLGVQRTGDTGQASSHRRPGAAARDAKRLASVLAAVFQTDAVCLFDAIEEYQRAKAEEDDEEGEAVNGEEDADKNDDDGSNEHESGGERGSHGRDDPLAALLLTEPPPWTITDPVVELKSIFVARCAPVTSPQQAHAYVQHLLASDKRIRTATHNMTAWRIQQVPGAGAGATSLSSSSAAASAVILYQDCDDDGETAAGRRLLHLMQLMDLWNVMVVVTRWYGGHKLGPRRFALINQAARDAFVRAGLVEPSKKK